MIVGRMPPPYGGVTVHLFRLTKHLEANSYPFRFCDLSGRAASDDRFLSCGNAFKLVSALLFRRYEVVHCHASNPWLFILVDLIVAWLHRRKTVYTLHGEGNLMLCENGPFLMRILLRGAFRRAARIITINSNCKQRALFFAASPENVLHMSAYLPPTKEETTSEHYPEEIEKFFAEHKRCFAAQGTFGNRYIGDDLYRFDLLGRSLSTLRSRHPDVGLCTLVSQTLDQSAREEILALRRELGLEKHWLILENFGSAIPIYLRCLAFIRPTMSDGDSLSIRECLDLGIPVVASNAVPRPDGCILFENGDLASLSSALLSLLADYHSFRLKAEQAKSDDCLEALLSCYRSVTP